MLKFIRSSVPALLVVALAAGAGFFALRPLPASTGPMPSEALDAEVLHARGCVVCQLPPFSHDGGASQFGSTSDLAPLTAL